MASEKRQVARRILTYYFSLVFKAAGLRFKGDNGVEMAHLVDCIVDAAKEEIRDEDKAATIAIEQAVGVVEKDAVFMDVKIDSFG